MTFYFFPPSLWRFRMIWDIHIYIYFPSPGILYSLCNKNHKTFKVLNQKTFGKRSWLMSCIIYSHSIRQRGTDLWSYFQMKYFCYFFLPYEVLIEQWCFKNVHMETVRSTHVIVKWLVWCFILFSTRTSLEYPVWQGRLSCWKWTFASDFYFFHYFLFIFSLNLKLPKYAAELCAYRPDGLCHEGTAGPTVPVFPGRQVNPCGISPCPSDATLGLVSRPIDKLAMKKHVLNVYRIVNAVKMTDRVGAELV